MARVPCKTLHNQLALTKGLSALVKKLFVCHHQCFKNADGLSRFHKFCPRRDYLQRQRRTKSPKKWHSTIILGDEPINQAQHYKYLGVLIDANLNFKQHVDKLLVKISKRIGVLGRIRNNLTVDAANKVYQSLVLPVMDYCDVAWSSIGKIERRLDRAQRRAAKIVLKTKDSDTKNN